MQNVKRVFVFLIVLIFVLASANIAVYAISASNITVILPVTGGYYCRNESYYIAAKVNGTSSPATVTLSYPYTGAKGTWNMDYIGNNEYLGTFTPSASVWTPGTYVSTVGEWTLPFFRVKTTVSGSSISKGISGFVTIGTVSDYEDNDSTFTYISPTENSFRNVSTYSKSEAMTLGTATYNCLAYVIGVYNSWQWPGDWNGRNPTQAQLNAFMTASSNYASRPGLRFVACASSIDCDVIYYSHYSLGTGDDGHFARVIEWDTDGVPTKIVSKWGNGELIESESLAPFTDSYGSPKAYYKIAQ